jgi:hypothetical protein
LARTGAKSLIELLFGAFSEFRVDCRQTAPYSPELEPDIVLTQPHASGVDETCTPLVIAEGGSIPLHWMAELIAFSTWVSYGGNRAECSA